MARSSCPGCSWKTVALLHDFEVRLAEFVTARDLSAINVLVDNRTFSSKLEDWLKERPSSKAESILKYIDKFDKRFQACVNTMIDCQSFATQTGLATISPSPTSIKSSRTTTFSPLRRFEAGILLQIYFGYATMGLVEACLERIDDLLGEVAALQIASSA